MKLGVFERKFRCFVKISTILLDILCRRKNKITWLKNYSCEWSNEQKKNILGWIKRLFLSRPSSVCYLECQEREIFCEFSNFNRNHYARRINKKEKKERGWEDFARTGLLSVANVYNEFHENQKWMMELKFKNEKKKQKRKKRNMVEKLWNAYDIFPFSIRRRDSPSNELKFRFIFIYILRIIAYCMHINNIYYTCLYINIYIHVCIHTNIHLSKCVYTLTHMYNSD